MHKVQIGYVHQNMVTHSFHHSLMRLTNRDSQSDGYQLTPHLMAVRGSTMSLPEARNELMRSFLDETNASHLLILDTDMGFPSNTIQLLLEENKPVIGALCYGQAEIAPDDLGGYETEPFPVAYDLARAEQDAGPAFFTLKTDLNIEARKPVQVAGTGTACLLVSRDAARKVRAAFNDTWFDQVTYDTTPKLKISEDLSFCYRLLCTGNQIWVHTGVRTSHMKNVWLS